VLDKPECSGRIRGSLAVLGKITLNPGIKTQEAAVRVRSLARMAFVCALSVCAIQNNSSQAFGTISSCPPVNGIHSGFTNFTEEPAAYSSPISSESLPQFGQPVASDALWFSSLAFKSSSALVSYDPAESRLSIIFTATHVIEPISSITVSETVGNPFSCSG
jgi:hypothetical protein